MLTEMVQGRGATEIAALPKEDLLEEIGIPLTPVRLKCAILGLGVLKVALHRAKGTPLPEEWSTLADELEFDVAMAIEVGPAERAAGRTASRSSIRRLDHVGVYNLNGEYFALEDRCSHDDGPLCEGDFDPDRALRSARGTARTSTSAPAGRARCRRSSPSPRFPSASRTGSSSSKSSSRGTRSFAAGRATTPRTTPTTTRSGAGRSATSAGLLERLCLEGFQSGLSWLTILRKRESFRAAFAGFDPDAVARFGERTSSGCSATRASSAIAARSRRRSRTRARRSRCARRGRRCEELVWEYRRDEPAAARVGGADAGSVELSKRLRKAGFRFVGPTTVYSTMQACGIVNDHRADCWVRDAVERER